jgi:hypothetical protein
MEITCEICGTERPRPEPHGESGPRQVKCPGCDLRFVCAEVEEYIEPGSVKAALDGLRNVLHQVGQHTQWAAWATASLDRADVHPHLKSLIADMVYIKQLVEAATGQKYVDAIS